MNLQPVPEVCRLLDLSERNLHGLVKRGIVPREQRGQYDVDAVVPAYIRHLRAMAAGRTAKDGKIDVVAERARLAKEQADAMAMKNATARGELVPATEVEQAVIAVHSAVQRRLLGLPAAVAPLVAVEDEARACQAILREHIEDALEGLADATVERAKAAAAAADSPAEREPDC